MTKRSRLHIVDVLTLMATVLVVMGHHKFLRGVIGWYPVYDKIIYSFHMGFFMSISGFLIKYTFSLNQHWGKYIGRRVRKFVPAYLTVGVLAALLSFESWEVLIHNMLMLTINPIQGPIQIIWYIYVLLLYYMVAPFIFGLSSKQRWWLLLFSLIPAAFCIYIPQLFCLRNFFRLMPFFLLGSQIADNYERVRAIADWKFLLMGLPFVAFLIICIMQNDNPIAYGTGYGRLLTSLISLPLMYWIGRKFVCSTKIVKVSTKFSSFVYSVYLWQMFFIEGSWKVWQKAPWTLNDITAMVYLVCSVTFTLLGIIMMTKVWRWYLKTVLSQFKKNGGTSDY